MRANHARRGHPVRPEVRARRGPTPGYPQHFRRKLTVLAPLALRSRTHDVPMDETAIPPSCHATRRPGSRPRREARDRIPLAGPARHVRRLGSVRRLHHAAGTAGARTRAPVMNVTREFDLKRFMGLARGMGIPADDAARLAMNIVFEQRRANHPSALHRRRAGGTPEETVAPTRPRLHLVAPLSGTGAT